MPELLSTEQAAAVVGVPVPDFTELVEAVGLTAAVPGSKTRSRQWMPADIEALRDSAAGVEARALVARDAEVEAAVAALAGEFPTWRDAAGPAADALFQFNRYAKWAACSNLRRRALYALKDELIEVLVEAGYCRGLEAETVTHADTGDTSEYLALSFHIDGRWYSWHTPRSQVEWAYTLTPPPADRPAWKQEWTPNAGPKPVRLDAAEFVRAEAVVRYVLAGWAAERAAAKAEAKRLHAEKARAEGLARQAKLRQDAKG